MNRQGAADGFCPSAERGVSMPAVDPGTAIPEDFSHEPTLSKGRTEFDIFGADEYFRDTEAGAIFETGFRTPSVVIGSASPPIFPRRPAGKIHEG